MDRLIATLQELEAALAADDHARAAPLLDRLAEALGDAAAVALTRRLLDERRRWAAAGRAAAATT